MDGSVLANKSAVDRSKTDFYPTPPEVTTALMNYLNLTQGMTILEPACGDGMMASVLKNMSYKVIASDLYDMGYGEIGVDFLGTENTEADWIITNPPFVLSVAFIEKCIQLKKPFALLLKSQYWHSKSRLSLFEKHKPKAVLPLTWRPDFLFGKKSGSPTMECVWVIWDSEPSEYTIYQPIAKPQQSTE